MSQRSNSSWQTKSYVVNEELLRHMGYTLAGALFYTVHSSNTLFPAGKVNHITQRVLKEYFGFE